VQSGEQISGLQILASPKMVSETTRRDASQLSLVRCLRRKMTEIQLSDTVKKQIEAELLQHVTTMTRAIRTEFISLLHEVTTLMITELQKPKGKMENQNSKSEYLNSPSNKCRKCGGYGWVWRHELETPNFENAADDTRYICPECNGTKIQKPLEEP